MSHRPTLRFLLRERTAAAHAALDAAVGGFDTLDSYKRYLRGQLAFRGPVEACVEGVALPSWFDGWRPHAIAAAIRADMSDLEVAAPPFYPSDGRLVAQTADPAALVGTLYVLEGAALGARLLLQRAIALGLSATFGARHLAPTPEGAGGWRRFAALLDRGEPVDADAAALAAERAFSLARQAFAKEHDAP